MKDEENIKKYPEVMTDNERLKVKRMNGWKEWDAHKRNRSINKREKG